MEGSTAVFTTSQIDLYGFPEYYGYTDYLVISDNECPMVMDYAMEQGGDTRGKLRPVHRYNRTERFTRILAQLLGLKTTVPSHLLAHMGECTCWEDVRQVLKQQGASRYYNCVPSIMVQLGLERPITLAVDNTLFLKMVNDFQLFQAQYARQTHASKYFPSLRYIAFKIMQDNNAEFNDVQFIRTRRIEDKLDKIWENIMFY